MANCSMQNISQNTVTLMLLYFAKCFAKYNNLLKTTKTKLGIHWGFKCVLQVLFHLNPQLVRSRF